MEDSLMRVFGGERVKNLMGTFGIPHDQPIEMRLLSSTLESAQTRIEGFHFDARKQVLAYDDILNQQRLIIYSRRRKLLVGDGAEVQAVLKELHQEQPDSRAVTEAKVAELGTAVFMDLLRRLVLQTIDTLWVEHLEVMQYTRSSVTLRAYGQRDPLIEYRKEGTRLFKEMQAHVWSRVAAVLPQLQPRVIALDEATMRGEAKAAQAAAGASTATPKKSTPRSSTSSFGRNDLVTITNGTDRQTLKYKKAEPLLRVGWTLETSA
jgi:preprotein translocase subunit SecA